MARYRKWDLRTWNDQKFRELTPLPPSGQSLWMYLILGPFTSNIPGLFEASEVAMAHKLRWSVEAFREAFREASAKAMAKADWSAGLVWLPNSPKYNKPESPNVVISWGPTFDELPECALKWEALQSLKAFTEDLGEGFCKAFRKAFGKALPEGYAESGAGAGTGSKNPQTPTPSVGAIRPNGHPPNSRIHGTNPRALRAATDAASLAYQELIDSGGAKRDDLVQAALEAIGGWPRVQMRKTSEADQVKREFCEAFRDAQRFRSESRQ